MARPLITLGAALGGLFFAGTAMAVPNIVTESNRDDDATITLRVMTETITPNDIRSFCEIRIVDDGEGDEWRSGDRFRVELRESDSPAGHDLIWPESDDVWHTVTASEVSANRVDRTFDCRSDFEDDGFGGTMELYAWAVMEKDDTCGVCRYDRPETDNVDSTEVDDDGSEDNEDAATATAVPAGRTNNFISKDADYLSRNLSAISSVQFDILHNPDIGRLLGTVNDPDGNAVTATVEQLSDRTRVTVDALPIGASVLVVTPENVNDPNFYDINIVETPVVTECTPGESDTLPCGNCGGQARICTNFGMWETGEECLNQGECAQGAMETEACDGGAERSRSCSNACEWEDFGECVGGSCEGSETISCYTGEPVTEGIGPCTGGTRTCVNGTFSDCVGEVTPQAEICGNGIDDDCDDDDDLRDDDCDNGLALLGEPCDGDDECDAQWTCLGDPEPDRFIDGYCGDDQPCSGEPNECTADGVCADLGDAEYCLLQCGDGIGCRFGYTCATLDEGNACIPRCRDDNDCFFDDAGTCNVGTGLCEGADGPGGPGGDTDVAEIGGCNCSTGPTAGWAFLGGLGLLLVGLGRRRR